MRGVHANGWSGNTTTVDLNRMLPVSVEQGLARNHNIQSVRVDEPHRLTVHITIANSIGDSDAASALRDYIDLPWKEQGIGF
jgi:hypothetical protein